MGNRRKKLFNSRSADIGNEMPLLKKIKDSVGFQLPPMDVSPERENEIIEKVAGFISKIGMEWPTLLIGSAYVPVATIVTQTTLLPLAPFLEAMGIRGFQYTAFFEKKDNVRRLLERVEELMKQKEQAKS